MNSIAASTDNTARVWNLANGKLPSKLEGHADPLTHAAFSPDGHHIAFVSRMEGGSSWLWIRTLDSEQVRKVEGSEGATGPFWSPDGQDLAFFADNKLKRTPATGGMFLFV